MKTFYFSWLSLRPHSDRKPTGVIAKTFFWFSLTFGWKTHSFYSKDLFFWSSLDFGHNFDKVSHNLKGASHHRGCHHRKCVTNKGWHHALPPRVSPFLATPLISFWILYNKFQPSSLYCLRDIRIEKTFAAKKAKWIIFNVAMEIKWVTIKKSILAKRLKKLCVTSH